MIPFITTKHTIENKNILALFNNSLKGKKVIKRHKQSHKHIALGEGKYVWFAHEQTACPARLTNRRTNSESLFTLKRRLSLKQSLMTPV